MQYLSQIGGRVPGINIITHNPNQTPSPTQRPVQTPRPPVIQTTTPRPPIIRPVTPQPPIIRPVTPRPTPARQKKVTLINTLSIVEPGMMRLNEYGYIDVRAGGKISFKFRTLEPRGIVLFFRRKDEKNQLFIAFEIFDDKLYYVSDFGARSRRLLVSKTKVNDGTWQNVELEFREPDRSILTFNRFSQDVSMTKEEFKQAYFNDGVYLGGQPDDFTSWYIWSRANSFLGCFGDIILENTSKLPCKAVDLVHNYC